MKTDVQIIDVLNGALRHELTLINQYFLHARMLKNWGYEAVGKMMYQQSITAMKNADSLIERIFFLEGLPNLQDLGKLLIGETVEEAIRCDRKATASQHEAQIAAIISLENSQDYVSRKLLREQLHKTENYLDWLDEQQSQIQEIGLPNYLQSAIAN